MFYETGNKEQKSLRYSLRFIFKPSIDMVLTPGLPNKTNAQPIL